MEKVIVRFAPSPTGNLHIGGLRTALFNWLWARKNKGKFILRIEDTDRARYIDGAVENIQEALDWYGLDIDEGPIFQSDRLDIYKDHVNQLLTNEKAYYCFCSAERLEEVRKIQKVNKQATKYDGLCRSLSKEEIKKRMEQGEEYVIRLRVPDKGETVFNDQIYGQVKVQNRYIDDQVLIKSDGYPTYHLANVIDDYKMQISHVIRAEEWLPSTPKHIILYQAFNWPQPIFAHLPMVLGEDRTKLSKRHGALASLEYKKMGYLPESVLNFIALLGWNPKNEKEFFNLNELINEFDLGKVNKSSAIFNLEKLNWLNGNYIRSIDIDKLIELAKPFLLNIPIDDRLKSSINLVRGRIKNLHEINEALKFIYDNTLEYKPELLVPKKDISAGVINSLQKSIKLLSQIESKSYTAENLKDLFKNFISENNLNNRIVLWPLRVAITGLENSPDVFDVMEVLGKKIVLQRVEKAQEYLQNP